MACQRHVEFPGGQPSFYCQPDSGIEPRQPAADSLRFSAAFPYRKGQHNKTDVSGGPDTGKRENRKRNKRVFGKVLRIKG